MRTHAFTITLVMQFCPAAFMGVAEPLEGLKMGGGAHSFHMEVKVAVLNATNQSCN